MNEPPPQARSDEHGAAPDTAPGDASARDVTGDSRDGVEQRFRSIGESMGAEVVRQIEDGTRTEVQKLLLELRRELRALRSGGAAADAGESTAADSDGSDGSDGSEGPGSAGGTGIDSPAVVAAVARVEEQLRAAALQWRELVDAMAALGRDAGAGALERSFEEAFGSLVEAATTGEGPGARPGRARGGAGTRARRVSLDDVAAMIGEITGRPAPDAGSERSVGDD